MVWRLISNSGHESGACCSESSSRAKMFGTTLMNSSKLLDNSNTNSNDSNSSNSTNSN